MVSKKERQLAHVVQFAGQGRGKVEAEAVDVHLRAPVAQRIHDHLEHLRIAHVQRVAGAGVVHVELRIVGDQAVVSGVADALPAQHGAQVIALAGVVVDHVEDHLDARRVQRLHHLFELAHLAALVAGRTVARHRRKEAERVVSPVVAQAAIEQEAFVDEVVNGQQLDGGDAELLEVIDAGFVGQAGISAAQFFGDFGIANAEAADVHFVDDRVGQRHFQRHIVAPVEVAVDNHRLGNAGRAVLRSIFRCRRI